MYEPVLETEEQAKKIIIDNILPQYKNNLDRWAIHTKDNMEFIGWCGLKYLLLTSAGKNRYEFYRRRYCR